MLPSAYLATNIPRWELYETKTYLLCDFHKSFHVTPQGVALMPQDVCIASMAQKKSACITFGPRTAKTEEPFFAPCQPLTSPWSIQLGPTIIWWIWAISLFISVGLHKSSISITRGKPCVEEVASVARESACVFPLLGICSKLKDLNPDRKFLT